jgi:hypothetical protein
MKSSAFTLLFILSISFCFGQIKRHNTKAAFTPAVILKDFAVDYEFTMLKKLSINTRTNVMVPLKNPANLIGQLDLPNDGIGKILGAIPATDAINFNSFGVSPQLRFYPKGEAPKGFYITAYQNSQFSNFTAFDYSFEDKNGAQKIEGTAEISNRIIGAGLGFGKQYIVGPGITIDIIWLGVGFGTSTLSIRGDAKDPNNPIKFNEENVGDFYLEGSTINYGGDFVEIEIKAPMVYPKILNFAIGFAF